MGGASTYACPPLPPPSHSLSALLTPSTHSTRDGGHVRPLPLLTLHPSGSLFINLKVRLELQLFSSRYFVRGPRWRINVQYVDAVCFLHLHVCCGCVRVYAAAAAAAYVYDVPLDSLPVACVSLTLNQRRCFMRGTRNFELSLRLSGALARGPLPSPFQGVQPLWPFQNRPQFDFNSLSLRAQVHITARLSKRPGIGVGGWTTAAYPKLSAKLREVRRRRRRLGWRRLGG